MKKLYWIWLQCALGVGNAAGDTIVKQGLSPESLYFSSEQELIRLDFLPEGLIRKLKACPIQKAEKILRQCEALKIWILCPDDEDYPRRLKHIYQIPLVLYGIGNRSLLGKELLLTMVGTRNATAHGCKAARDLAQDLVQYGFGIVSGLALGIDSCSHEGALAQGGITIGVAGCGLDINYPTGNQELRRSIAKQGAIISEYPPGWGPRPGNFPIRNRILSGLSLGTIVVEASTRSGSLITADLALQQGRDVFALPTDIYNKSGSGNLRLLGDGATLVLSAETIAEEYSALYGDTMSKTIESRILLHREEASPSIKKEEALPEESGPASSAVQPIPADLDEASAKVAACLEDKKLRAEEISLACHLTMQETLAILTELEIEGLIRAYPGKQFGR